MDLGNGSRGYVLGPRRSIAGECAGPFEASPEGQSKGLGVKDRVSNMALATPDEMPQACFPDTFLSATLMQAKTE